MSTAQYRMGFLYRQLYERFCQSPSDWTGEYVLENRVERWQDVPVKQQERLRLGGAVLLGRYIHAVSYCFFVFW